MKLKCTCGYCAKASKVFPLKEPLCCTGSADVSAAVVKMVSTSGGNTMIMTLPSGKNIVRFMVPSSPATPAGSVGKYSEGIDTNMSVAMAIALAGLSG